MWSKRSLFLAEDKIEKMQMKNKEIILGEQAGLLWTWWRGDLLPTLPPLPTLTVAEMMGSTHLMAMLMGISDNDVETLLQEGHRPYVAYLSSIPVAYGWSAINRANFGEGQVHFQIPVNNRYLYDFVTLPTWRGLGIYPRLLQAILRRESREYERFWIIHQLANVASQHGIARAGFRIASHVYFINNDKLALVPPEGEGQRAQAGAALFGLPLLEKK
jgi:GNAT superfamily N-acetyltransferase